jgi:hypothetical protein
LLKISRESSFSSLSAIPSRVLALACPAVLLVCLLVIHPVVEMGINDDWSYIRTAQVLAQTGHISYNGWATAMLGWQIFLGALFIKLFGFSFTAVRASTLVVSLPGTYLLHRVLVRFGLSAWSAVAGTLLIVLSPIFLPIVFTFMSDVTGFFCLVLCLYACQRALQSETTRQALAWLCFAAISNAADGTVRQIAWLGVLVMVPCTAWMLRRRKGVLLAGALLWIGGCVAIYASVHWFLAQPYSIPEESIARTIDRQVVVRLLHSLADLFLSLLLFVSPVLMLFVPRLFELPKKKSQPALLLIGMASVVAGILGAVALHGRRSIDMLLLPWLGNIVTPYGILRYHNIVGAEPLTLPLWLRLVATLLVVAGAACCAAVVILDRRPSEEKLGIQVLTWAQTAGLLLPFFVAYIGLLIPRAAFRLVVDRYLPPLVLVGVVFALRYLQERNAGRRAVLVAFGLSGAFFAALTFYSLAGAHDVFSLGRARVLATERLTQAGVPATAISGGMEYDGWTQVVTWGYIDEPHLKNPVGAYRPQPESHDPCRYWFLFLTPAVDPEYVLAYEPNSCYVPSQYAPVAYSTWMPPYRQKVYIQRVR